MASPERVEQATGAPLGFAGPVGLPQEVPLVADQSVRELFGFVAGANRQDAHLTGVEWGRDATPSTWGDFLLAAEGDLCPRCRSELRLSRGIEVGHIFKLGTKYSEAIQCRFTDEEGREHPMIMGCYGLGVGRTVAAAIEQNHDQDGSIWPAALAPFEVVIITAGREPEVMSAAESVYSRLLEAGVEVIFDDRDERPGVKFKDADLIGFPLRIVVGNRNLANGQIEWSRR